MERVDGVHLPAFLRSENVGFQLNAERSCLFLDAAHVLCSNIDRIMEDRERLQFALARGVRMPRKSTSFAPKPRMGLVLRDLRDA